MKTEIYPATIILLLNFISVRLIAGFIREKQTAPNITPALTPIKIFRIFKEIFLEKKIGKAPIQEAKKVTVVPMMMT